MPNRGGYTLIQWQRSKLIIVAVSYFCDASYFWNREHVKNAETLKIGFAILAMFCVYWEDNGELAEHEAPVASQVGPTIGI